MILQEIINWEKNQGISIKLHTAQHLWPHSTTMDCIKAGDGCVITPQTTCTAHLNTAFE